MQREFRKGRMAQEETKVGNFVKRKIDRNTSCQDRGGAGQQTFPSNLVVVGATLLPNCPRKTRTGARIPDYLDQRGETVWIYVLCSGAGDELIGKSKSY